MKSFCWRGTTTLQARTSIPSEQGFSCASLSRETLVVELCVWLCNLVRDARMCVYRAPHGACTSAR